MRSTTPELDQLVARLLAGHLVEDVQAPPNYSLRMSSAARSGRHRLVEGHRNTVVRTRSLHRLLRALGAFLDSHAVEQDTAALHVGAVVLVYQRQALLLPPALRQAVLAEEELRLHGFRVLDSPTAALDPATGELVVTPPTLTLNDGALGEAVPEPDPAEAPPTVRPGRYPIRLWADITFTEKPTTPSRAVLVAQANQHVRNLTAVGPQTALSALARVASNARPVAVYPTRFTRKLLEQLERAFDGPA